jgi:hypothetical protein
MLLSRAGTSPALLGSSSHRRAPRASAGAMSAAAAPSSPPRPRQQQRRPLAPPPQAASAENFDGAMLEPSAANKLPVRAAALVASVGAAAYLGAPSLPQSAAAFLHLLAVSTYLGASLWTTFVAGIVMFKNLPRQMFGRLQAKLFPLYFVILATTALVAFATLAAATQGGAAAAAGSFGGRALLAAAVGSLANALWLEPAATEVMFARYAIENKYPGGATKSAEDTARTTALGKRFGALHGGSSLANLFALCAMVAYSWRLAGQIVLAA